MPLQCNYLINKYSKNDHLSEDITVLAKNLTANFLRQVLNLGFLYFMPLCASVYLCLVVTCWERADLLVLVCGV